MGSTEESLVPCTHPAVGQPCPTAGKSSDGHRAVSRQLTKASAEGAEAQQTPGQVEVSSCGRHESHTQTGNCNSITYNRHRTLSLTNSNVVLRGLTSGLPFPVAFWQLEPGLGNEAAPGQTLLQGIPRRITKVLSNPNQSRFHDLAPSAAPGLCPSEVGHCGPLQSC